jgi:hypothetical protein
MVPGLGPAMRGDYAVGALWLFYVVTFMAVPPIGLYLWYSYVEAERQPDE